MAILNSYSTGGPGKTYGKGSDPGVFADFSKDIYDPTALQELYDFEKKYGSSGTFPNSQDMNSFYQRIGMDPYTASKALWNNPESKYLLTPSGFMPKYNDKGELIDPLIAHMATKPQDTEKITKLQEKDASTSGFLGMPAKKSSIMDTYIPGQEDRYSQKPYIATK